ncbi:ABC transporter ATP-binding protein [Nocardioides soli]|uniref:NitT/TauT family transport system ATP-binding protein n=1 Tax=Nocardioides soli TaxID=1036020 RepID=A0A7W4VYQ9_9ACTN|nr:ABC transporter ATP-binding protein [Nocardioides soli]MBB3044190.1 NitT/TauT family transport system ATP-binding protein [Nocardioides soli]
MSTYASTPTLAGAQIRDLTVEFPDPTTGGSNVVLRGIDLDVAAGEFVALIGRSGCGKTTLLNVLAGLVRPTSGEVTVAGLAPAQARSEIGYMFARDALLPWRTALGNVEYGMELHRKVPRSERRTRATRYLERVHMGHAAKQWPWQLSQGMRQRVALARTWALEPQVLLMDEPFAALDAQTRMSVHAEFLDVWESSKKSVVFVTHDLTEALQLADRVVLLSDGRIAEDITVPFARPRTAELSTTPEFQELRRHLIEQIF